MSNSTVFEVMSTKLARLVVFPLRFGYLRLFSFGFPLFFVSVMACVIQFCVGIAYAERTPFVYTGGSTASSPFVTPAELAPYVNFWKLVFTKYTKQHVIFHHREHPEIVYNVLDFSDYTFLSDKMQSKAIQDATDAHQEKIRQDLLYLHAGGSPETSFQRRIVQLFSGVSSPNKYLEATQDNMIRSQSGMREHFSQGIARSGRYLYAIEYIFEREGLPKELARLPLIESSFNYNAVSSVGASGIWQFMRTTGKQYMRIDNAVDERRDAIVSSRSAALYLKRAHKVLGSWPLAISSYNHGVSGIKKASKQVGSSRMVDLIKKYEGPAFGFASKNFYVSFLAALEVSKNYRSYYPDLVIEEPVHFEEFYLTEPTTFSALVGSSGLAVEDFISLNPAFLEPVQKGKAKVPANSFVKVPIGRGATFKRTYARARPLTLSITTAQQTATLSGGSDRGQRETAPELHAALAGESSRGDRARLAPQVDESPDIKVAYNTNQNRGRNGGRNGEIQIDGSSHSEISEDDKLALEKVMSRIRESQANKQRDGQSDTPEARGERAMSEAGLSAASEKSKPANSKVARANTAKKSKYNPPVSHTVKKGDTLTSIAKEYKLGVSELKDLNPELKGHTIKPGYQIVVGERAAEQQVALNEVKQSPTKTNRSQADKPKATAKKASPATYTVKPGDSLDRIAKAHGITVQELKGLNPTVSEKIKPGNKIQVD